MSERFRAHKFPPEWFSSLEYVPSGGGEPREASFNRSSHAQYLLTGIRQAILSKPEQPLVPDSHIYFTARTWKDRPSLRRNVSRINAKIYRILPDGGIVGGWQSRVDYEETKEYIRQYSLKQSKTADLDYIESIKGLDFRDKLGKSLLVSLEEQDDQKEGLLELTFYPDYSESEVGQINSQIRLAFGSSGLEYQRLISGAGRFTSVWRGLLGLAQTIAERVEAVALVEQTGELRPAATNGINGARKSNLTVAVRPVLPEIGVLDTGVEGSHPLLAGVLMTGDAGIDHIDADPSGGHGTFVAGVLAYGDDPLSQVSNGQISPRALIHPKEVNFSGSPGGINLEAYDELATTVEALRARTKVFTVSFSTALPIDSDSISLMALNLDLVSHRYGVLFVLPVGNLPNIRNNALSVDQPDFRNPSSWLSDTNAQMGRPGEAFNAITVASYAERSVGDEYAGCGEVNIYSRRGPGPKAIPKPDVAESGGNCVLMIDLDDPTKVDLTIDTDPLAAITGLQTPGTVGKSFGTSFAVPKIAFALAKLVEDYKDSGADAPLLAKAHLIHICRYPPKVGPFPVEWTGDEQRQKLHLLYGHGVPDSTAMDEVLPTELCFYDCAEIERRQKHIYSLDLPANILEQLPDIRLRVTITYFTKVDPNALDAELYSLVDISVVVRWGGRTLNKLPRAGTLTDFYPLKSFDVRFARPRDGEVVDKGQPVVEVFMRDRAFDEDDLHQRYAILISLISSTGELLLNEMVREMELV